MFSKTKKVFFFFLLIFITIKSWTQEDVFTIIDLMHQYNLDPQQASYSSEAQILTGLYEGLFSYDPYTLAPIPAIAQSYKVSRNKLRWTFYLREDAKFSNGESITAQTIKDSWITLLNRKDAPFVSLFDCIKGAYEYRTGKISEENIGITVQDTYRIAITLNTPTEHLLNILCHHPFVAVHPDKNVYSGPFVLESYENNVLNLVKNPNYYDKENVKLNKIKIIQSNDSKENSHLFNIGKVDWILNNADIPTLIDHEKIKISAEFATEYLFFKSDKFPWNQSGFRNALLAATPWQELRSQAFVPAETFIYPIKDYTSPAGLNDYDLEEAKLLLQEAKQNAGLKDSDKIEISIAITDSQYMTTIANLLKNSWEQLDVSVEINKTTDSKYIQLIKDSDADLFHFTWIGDFADPLAFLELFRSDSTINESMWKNEQYNQLLKEAAIYTGTDRLKLLSQAEDILLSEGVIIPISHPVTLNVIDTNIVKGWYTNPLDIHPFKHLLKQKEEIFIPNLI